MSSRHVRRLFRFGRSTHSVASRVIPPVRPLILPARHGSRTLTPNLW